MFRVCSARLPQTLLQLQLPPLPQMTFNYQLAQLLIYWTVLRIFVVTPIQSHFQLGLLLQHYSILRFPSFHEATICLLGLLILLH